MEVAVCAGQVHGYQGCVIQLFTTLLLGSRLLYNARNSCLYADPDSNAQTEVCHEALRPSCLIYGATWLHEPLV